MPEIVGIIEQDSDIIPVQPEINGIVRVVDTEGQPLYGYPADNITSIGDTSREGISLAVTRSHPELRTRESKEYFRTQEQRGLKPELNENNPWGPLREGLTVATIMRDKKTFATGITIADYKIGVSTDGETHEISKSQQTEAPDSNYDIPPEQADKREIVRDAMNYLPGYYNESTDSNKGGLLCSADRLAQNMHPNERRFIIDQIRRDGNLHSIRNREQRSVAGMMIVYDRLFSALSERYITHLENFYESQPSRGFLPLVDRTGDNHNKTQFIKNTVSIFLSELMKHRILQRNDSMFGNDPTTPGIADMMHEMYRENIKRHQEDMGYQDIMRGESSHRRGELSRHSEAHIAARTPHGDSWYSPGRIDFGVMIHSHIESLNRGMDPLEIQAATAICISQIAELQNTLSSLTYQREDSDHVTKTLFTGDEIDRQVNTVDHLNALLSFMGAPVFPEGVDPFNRIR